MRRWSIGGMSSHRCAAELPPWIIRSRGHHFRWPISPLRVPPMRHPLVDGGITVLSAGQSAWAPRAYPSHGAALVHRRAHNGRLHPAATPWKSGPELPGNTPEPAAPLSLPRVALWPSRSHANRFCARNPEPTLTRPDARNGRPVPLAWAAR